MGHSHKPGSLKQPNKAHKTRTSSKRSVKRGFGNGRVETSEGKKGKLVKPHKNEMQNARNDRVNRNAMIRKNKNANVNEAQRIGALRGPPKVVGLISLSEVANTYDCLDELLKESSWKETNEESGLTYAYFDQHKSRCAFVLGQDIRDVQEAVEIARVADLLICVVDVADINMAGNYIDGSGHSVVSAIKAIGCPEVLFCYTGISKVPQKQVKSVKQLVQDEAERQFGSAVKTGDMSKVALVARQMCNMASRTLQWRKHRSYLIADSWQVVCGGEQQEDGTTSVKLKGYMRGRPLALNSLMQLCGVGVARIESISSGGNPFAAARGGKAASTEVEMVDSSADGALKADPAKQESLRMEADGDGMVGEQTWPTEEEMNEAMNKADEGAGRHRRAAPAVIKSGMSSYQADWFVDEEGNFDAEGAQVDEKDIVMEEEKGRHTDIPDQEDEDDDDMDMGGSMVDAPVHDAVTEKQRLRALADDDAMFPDEMDTPHDKPARDRFARFRALQSFRSSPWHPKENLPHDYSRIFQFENFSNVQRNVLGASEMVQQEAVGGGGVRDPNYPYAFCVKPHSQRENAMEEEEEQEQGSLTADGAGELFVLGDKYVEIVLSGVPAANLDLKRLPCVVAVGLMEHENKMSVLHFTIRRTGLYADPIKSKESLVFQTGFRTFEAKPIFSESNLNCDKHKMERFLREDAFTMASVYGPVTYIPCPLLVYKRLANGSLVLVATGSLTKIDPDRIMLKKVILTGLPIRVRKRMAVIKHLFYNTNDVRWFKPAELVTKHGIRGHIKEPVGTHGLFKCLFSAPISQADTLMLILYKRVFPKMVDGTVKVY
jgi:pre-rRNA-processing protein TSR1